MPRPPRQARTVQPLPAWGTAEAPPKEFRLFTFGETMGATWFGDERENFVLTREGGEAIVAEWSRRNIEGAFDRDHDFGDSRGTFDVELRADGLWVSSIQWTPETLSLFAAKKLRYYSPAFDVAYDAKGKEVRDAEGRLQITALLNIALTNYPATDNLRPLIALSQKKGGGRRRYATMMDIAAAKAQAAKIAEYVQGKEYTIDGLALMLMELAANPDAVVEPPAEDAPSEEGLPAMSADEETAKADEQIAMTARKLTGLTNASQVKGALHQLAAARTELTNARKELSQIKHVAAVELAIKERKLAPAKRDEALKQDPQFFAGFIALASPVIDETVLTPKTGVKGPSVEDLEKNPKLLAYCAKMGTDPKTYAATFHRNFPGEDFAD